jgi:hypothetical protein
VLFDCFAALFLEPSNPHDPNAVRVEIDCRKVGYLARNDAEELGPALRQALGAQGDRLVRAVIQGREADCEGRGLGVSLYLEISR